MDIPQRSARPATCAGKITRPLACAATLLLAALSPATVATETRSPGIVQIGVLAYNGDSMALDRWKPLASYLQAGIPGYRFEIVPLTHEGLRNHLRKGHLDFVLTNPANYVRLEVNFGATRIATLRSRYGDRPLTRFGSVIFTTKDSPIRNLKQLRGKRFAAVSPEAFGAFLLARKRLLDLGIDALSDLKPLWLGFPQRDIVQAVLEGHADAGTVRTGVLEAMIRDGQLTPGRLRILGQRRAPGFPLKLSTALYPEWPFVRMPHTDRELARKVTLRLLQMPFDSAVARTTNSAGWTIPLDYSAVQQLLRQLHIEPYPPHTLDLQEVWHQHAGAFILMLGVLGLVLATSGYILRINRKLVASQLALTGHKGQLEELVEQRTSALIAANEALRADIKSRIQYAETLHGGCECLQGVHALIVRADLTRQQRLQSILDLLQQYFDARQVLLSRVENGLATLCTASPPLDQNTMPLDSALAAAVIDTRTRLDRDIDSGDGRTLRYLATPAVREGEVVCLIELITAHSGSGRPDSGEDLGARILQLVAHWLAHEYDALAHEAQRDHAARHLGGLTPRERQVLLEVASGAPNKLIARHLGISVKTVELHRSNMMGKLEVKNAAELTRLAMQAGLIPDDGILVFENR